MVDIGALWRMQGAPVVIIPGQQGEIMTIQEDLNVWPLTHGALCGSEFPGERAPKPQILQTDLTPYSLGRPWKVTLPFHHRHPIHLVLGSSSS